MSDYLLARMSGTASTTLSVGPFTNCVGSARNRNWARAQSRVISFGPD
jgi:hypothetical protein